MSRKRFTPIRRKPAFKNFRYLLRLSKKLTPSVISFLIFVFTIHQKSRITNYNLYQIAVLCYPWPITFLGG